MFDEGNTRENMLWDAMVRRRRKPNKVAKLQ